MDEAREQQREHARLLGLQQLKRHYERQGNRSPFHDHRVITYDARAKDIEGLHVDVLHQDVRECLARAVDDVRHSGASRIVMLTGDPGVGKTHTLQWLRHPDHEQAGEYVVVWRSNHWELPELELVMLEELVETLTTSGPDGQDLLFKKMAHLAFRLLGDVVPDPHALARLQGTVPLTDRLRALLWPRQHSLGALYAERDFEAFRRLDRDRLVERFCLQFLADSENDFHRDIAEHLFRYLLDVVDRPAVKAWFKNPPTLARRVEMIRVLASLFAPSKREPENVADPVRVFVFAFDQIEARAAFMPDTTESWLGFFGRVSELYNTLPNVLVVFTMTNSRSKELLGRMQGQFRDRIGSESRAVFELPSLAQVVEIYQRRLVHWLGRDGRATRMRLEEAGALLLPFNDERDLASVNPEVGNVSVRRWLERLDEAFGARMHALVVEPELDYLVQLRNYVGEEPSDLRSPEHRDYVERHLSAVTELVWEGTELLSIGWQLSVTAAPKDLGESFNGAQVVELTFQSAMLPAAPEVVVRVLYLPHQHNRFREPVLALLEGGDATCDFVWCLRAGPIEWEADPLGRLVFVQDLPPRHHTVVRTLLHLMLQRRAEYARDAAQLSVLDDLAARSLRDTWVGDLLEQVQEHFTRSSHTGARVIYES